MKTSEKIKKGYLLTPEEIEAEAAEMVKSIKQNAFPRMEMKCSGVPKKLTNANEQNSGKSKTEEQKILKERLEQYKEDLDLIDQFL